MAVKISKRNIKYTITIVSLFIAVVHFLFPELAIDHVTLALIGIAALPWLSGLFKSVPIPGLGQFDFSEEIKDVQRKILAEDPNISQEVVAEEEKNFLQDKDESLSIALVMLRIEMERILQKMVNLRGDAFKPKGILATIQHLRNKGVFNEEVTTSLKNLVVLLNQAAHGIDIGNEDAINAKKEGDKFLELLNKKLTLEIRKQIGAIK